MHHPPLTHITTIPLHHDGDCSLIGLTADLTIYAEEHYGADGWLAQHAIRLDGTMIDSVDEQSGHNSAFEFLPLPADIIRPQSGWRTRELNFSGPRHRGLRGPERIVDLVRPLSITDKMLLIERYQLDAAPPHLLGIAESYVLAEAALNPPDQFIVCRRMRVAYLLPQPRRDASNEPYDYDTHLIYMVHLYDRRDDTELPLTGLVAGLDATPLNRPMDCLIAHEHLLVADGGSRGAYGEPVSNRAGIDDRPSLIHIWKLNRAPASDNASG